MNQITLPVSELKQAFTGLSRVIQRKATLPVLQTLKLSRNDEGHVSLSATDLDAFVTYRLDAYGGGAAFVTAAEIKTLNTSEWLRQLTS